MCIQNNKKKKMRRISIKNYLQLSEESTPVDMAIRKLSISLC